MNGWEIDDPVGLLARGEKDAIREFSRSYQLAATNPEATGLLLIRKYALGAAGEPGALAGAPGLGKGFRVGLCVYTANSEHVFQLPTLRTYLSLSLLGEPGSDSEKIVIETDLGEALTTVGALKHNLSPMSAGEVDEAVLEDSFTAIE